MDSEGGTSVMASTFSTKIDTGTGYRSAICSDHGSSISHAQQMSSSPPSTATYGPDELQVCPSVWESNQDITCGCYPFCRENLAQLPRLTGSGTLELSNTRSDQLSNKSRRFHSLDVRAPAQRVPVHGCDHSVDVVRHLVTKHHQAWGKDARR